MPAAERQQESGAAGPGLLPDGSRITGRIAGLVTRARKGADVGR